jgi:ABC-type branched-subunit amino acid transport system substrate-binding protein
VQSKDRAAILDHMFNIGDFRGLLGTYSFDDNGDTTSGTISLNVVQDGAITYQETIGLPE